MQRYRVALAREWRGGDIEATWRQIAECCRRYGLSTATTDQYAASANAALAKRYGLTLHKSPVTAASKLEDFTDFATLLHTDLIELPPDREVRRDLLSIRKRATQTAYQIILPRTPDGRHCDLAAAVVSAVTRANRRGSVSAYREGREASRSARRALRPRDALGLGNNVSWYAPRDRRHSPKGI